MIYEGRGVHGEMSQRVTLGMTKLPRDEAEALAEQSERDSTISASCRFTDMAESYWMFAQLARAIAHRHGKDHVARSAARGPRGIHRIGRERQAVGRRVLAPDTC